MRFFGEGYLAIRYGAQASAYLSAHKVQFAIGAIVVAGGLYLIGHLFSRQMRQQEGK